MRTLKITLGITLLLIAIHFAGCKKNNNPSIGFSNSSVSLDAINSPSATVTVNLSSSPNDIVEVWFQLLGPDTLQFGSYNERFLNDDSNRILGVLSSEATIDSPAGGSLGHIRLGLGTTSFSIALTALFDNFPKRAVEYKIKIIKISNATIKSGSDVLTINIDQSPMVPVFSSTLLLTDTTGVSSYTLNSDSFTAAGNGMYNMEFGYAKQSGPSHVSGFNLLYQNFAPALGTHAYGGCGSNLTVSLITNTGNEVFSCNSGLISDSLITRFAKTTTPSPTRGNYYVMSNGAISWKTAVYQASDTLKCAFVLF